MATSTAWRMASSTCCATRRSVPDSARQASSWSATASTSACSRSGWRSSIRACWGDRPALSRPPQPGLGRVIWDAWRAYTHRAGGYQAQVLLSAVYYLVLGPSVLVARLFGTRLLDLDRRPRG